MRFKVDQNLPVDVASLLRAAGHEGDTVNEEQLDGISDADLAELCRRETRALITLDQDFGDIRAYPPGEYSGLVVLRLQRQDRRHVLEVCSRLLEPLSKEPLAGRLWIVETTRIRVRGGED